MTQTLKLYITWVVALSAVASPSRLFYFRWMTRSGQGFSAFGENAKFAGLAFWILLTLAASALPVRMPRGTLVGSQSRR